MLLLKLAGEAGPDPLRIRRPQSSDADVLDLVVGQADYLGHSPISQVLRAYMRWVGGPEPEQEYGVFPLGKLLLRDNLLRHFYLYY